MSSHKKSAIGIVGALGVCVFMIFLAAAHFSSQLPSPDAVEYKRAASPEKRAQKTPRVFTPEKRILIFHKTAAKTYDSIPLGIQTIKGFLGDKSVVVDATDDSRFFSPKQLKRYRAIVFLNTSGDVLNNVEQEAFQRYIQSGGGFVGIHGAANTEWKDNLWPWYTRLVGAAATDASRGKRETYTLLKSAENEHASIRHLPVEWKVTDHWYEFSRFNPAVKILLSREGKKPVAWLHDFDGGRAFYTSLGNDSAIYQDRDALEHFKQGILFAMGEDDMALDYAKAAPQRWRLKKQTIIQGMDEPMGIQFSPEGELYYSLRRGGIYHFDLTSKTSTEIGHFDVHTDSEDGIMGFTFDPDFSTNRWIYLYYGLPQDALTDGAMGTHRLSRFKLRNRQMDRASEEVLLEVPVTPGRIVHTGGELLFDHHKNLWLSVGDNTIPFESNGYAPIDDRAGRQAFDAARSSANTQDLRGKILRIRPHPEKGYGIPDGNLFTDARHGRPEIYIMGVRNPFRLTYDNRKDVLYWGEVGPDARQPHALRGPLGYDEFNRTTKPGNFGWPFVIGDNEPYAYYDFSQKKPGEFVDVRAPINASRNNTGLRELPAAQPAWIHYPYTLSDRFIEMGAGARSAMAGAVYYRDDYPDNREKLPRYFDGKVFIFDWMRRWIKTVEVGESGGIKKIEPFFPAGTFVAPIDMAFAPDGSLYILEYGSSWYRFNKDAKLTRITYFDGDNPSPIARAYASKPRGGSPLTTVLSAEQSYDLNPESGDLHFTWQLKTPKGYQTLGEGMQLTQTFTRMGENTVRLQVTDPGGAVATDDITLLVGNEPAHVAVDFPSSNDSFYWNEPHKDYAVQVDDREDGRIVTSGGEPHLAYMEKQYYSKGLPKVSAKTATLGHVEAEKVDPRKVKVEKSSDCMACHTWKTPSVGPSFQSVAQRYKDDGDAIAKLSLRIRQGTQGNWGDHAMPAHPQLTQQDAAEMVEYILAQRPGGKPSKPSLALSGRLLMNQHEATVRQNPLVGTVYDGVYTLSARYRDRSRNGVPGIVSAKTQILRHYKMVGSHFPQRQNVIVRNKYKKQKGLEVMIMRRGFSDAPESYLKLSDIDLTGIKAIRFSVIPRENSANIVLRRHGLQGDILGEVAVKAENRKTVSVTEYTLELMPSTQQDDIYFVFDSRSEKRDFLTLVAVEFLK